MKITSLTLIALLFLGAVSCNRNSDKADAYGNFEAEETLISAEVNGKLLEFSISEGDELKAGDKIGVIDTMQLYYQKKQLIAKKAAVETNFSSIVSQISVIDEQIKTLEKEKARVEKLLQSQVATQKQLDDIVGQINILEKQKASVKSQNASLFAEIEAANTGIEQVDDQLRRAYIVNPVNGLVLEKYVQEFELLNAGKPLYKIADMSEIILRAYISGEQLDDIKTGQKLRVEIDKSKDENYVYEGTVIWISSEAEFTPKIIQTKKERVSLVYAVKIRVVNDGKIKIGMPGEVYFD
ncbi:MAG TPA: HlyD family efflux transporter periplasmic adaptor subunit [Bacteroidales bacterium]|nr:HlyD family efflux transporter periplasmic adaptor subunit [Bacteroidales bacterium]